MTFHEIFPIIRYGVRLRVELITRIQYNDQKGGLLTKKIFSIPFDGELQGDSYIRNIANAQVDSMDVCDGSLRIYCSDTFYKTVEDVDLIQVEDEDCFCDMP